MRSLSRLLTFILTITIRGYQLFISPLTPGCCRYYPTCSNFALQSLRTHGLLIGMFLAIQRFLRCNPLGGFGYDPIPKKIRSMTKKSK